MNTSASSIRYCNSHSPVFLYRSKVESRDRFSNVTSRVSIHFFGRFSDIVSPITEKVEDTETKPMPSSSIWKLLAILLVAGFGLLVLFFLFLSVGYPLQILGNRIKARISGAREEQSGFETEQVSGSTWVNPFKKVFYWSAVLAVNIVATVLLSVSILFLVPMHREKPIFLKRFICFQHSDRFEV